MMSWIQNQVWVTIPIPKCKKPINHEIQLLFKYENLLLCVCGGGVGVCVCVCEYVWNISLVQNSHLFIYLFSLSLFRVAPFSENTALQGQGGPAIQNATT